MRPGLALSDLEPQDFGVKPIKIGFCIPGVLGEHRQGTVFLALAVSEDVPLRTFVQNQLTLWIGHPNAPTQRFRSTTMLLTLSVPQERKL